MKNNKKYTAGRPSTYINEESWLYRFRTARGMSKSQTARFFDICPTRYGELENEKGHSVFLNEHGWSTLAYKIADKLVTTPEQLFSFKRMEISYFDIKDNMGWNDEQLTPDELYDKKELASLLKIAIDKLTPRERVIILARYTVDFCYSDIQPILDLSNERIRLLHIRAISKLKRSLKELINPSVYFY